MDKRKIELERFDQIIDRVRRDFPELKFMLVREHPELEAAADFSVQPGLTIPVSINLQNADELHLCVGENFWVEWFPCGDDQKFEEYWEAVHGVLSGEFRVEESHIGARAVSATLQKPLAGGWKPVVRWGNLGGCLPLRRRKVILQNGGT